MIYLILIGAFVLLVAVLGVVFYGLVKLPWRITLPALLVIVGAPWLAFQHYERDYHLSLLPDALAVTSVEYSEEESWGFGPGGNEAGILVYPLPEATARRIGKQGLTFFETMPANANQQERRWRGYYTDWKETPVAPKRIWTSREPRNHLHVIDYICAYGFCIEIEQDFIDEANELVNSPGSYYAYGRIGMIIVAPGKKRVYYLYNG